MSSDKIKILIADDEQSILDLLGEMLEFYNFIVVRAPNGAEAWEKFSSDSSIDIVISDIFMPKLNGRDLMNRIRSSRPGVPVILMTGYITNDQLGKDNPDGFFQKPFNIQALVDKIHELVGR